MVNSNLLFESIFKQQIGTADAQNFFTEITAEHPYFSPAHFFLLLNTEKGTATYQQQAAKTAVLFNNSYWLQFKLQEEELRTAEKNDLFDTYDEKKVEPVENQLNIAPQAGEPNLHVVNSKTLADNEEAIILVSDAFPGQENLVNLHQSETVFIDIEEKDTGPVIDDQHLLELEEGMQEPVDLIVLQQSESLFNNVEEKDTGPVIDDQHLLELEERIQEPVEGNIEEPDNSNTMVSNEEISADKVITDKEAVTIFSDDTDLSQSVKKEHIQEEGKIKELNHESVFSNKTDTGSETNEISQSGHFNNQDSPLINEPETEDEIISEQETAPLNFKLNIDTTGITEDKITFEPLHTSDYFASLGIKLGNDIKPGDKLGKQLKSFTEWLKTMKKVHNDQLIPLSGQADMSIQQLAEQSNKDDTVATEAMADVLLMQGKKAKAIEVYKKLSLLNPSKSVYFAAKIDQLKEH